MDIRIDGEKINTAGCNELMARMNMESPSASRDELEKKAAEKLIERHILDEEAEKSFPTVPEDEVSREFERFKSGFSSEQEFLAMCAQNRTNPGLIMDEIRSSVRRNLLVKKICGKMPAPPLPVLKKYYKQNPAASRVEMQVHAAHIVKQARSGQSSDAYNRMLKIRRGLLKGDDFAEIAEKESDCNDSGGDLGFFSQGHMVEEFEAVVFSMDIGEISPVFKTPFGYHIATVKEIRPARKLKFEECRESIERELSSKLREEKVSGWVKKKKSERKIEIDA